MVANDWVWHGFKGGLRRAWGQDQPPQHSKPFQAAQAQGGGEAERTYPLSLAPKPPWSRARGRDLHGFQRFCGYRLWVCGCLPVLMTAVFSVDRDSYQFPERCGHCLEGRLVFTRLFQTSFSLMKSMCSKPALDWFPWISSGNSDKLIVSLNGADNAILRSYSPKNTKSREEGLLYAVKIAFVSKCSFSHFAIAMKTILETMAV